MRHSVSLTLEEVKLLLKTAVNLEREWQIPDQGGTHVPRRAVRAVEKDGIPMVVRFGYAVQPLEADITMFVAQNSSVRVPAIYGVFEDTSRRRGTPVYYIVEERLPGAPLEDLLPTMDEATLTVISTELQHILGELASLNNFRDDLGPLRGPWANDYFDYLLKSFPCGMEDARSTESFIKYFLQAYYTPCPDRTLVSARIEDSLSRFDLSRPPLFSHGDLFPSNIIVHDGHISGVVDWEQAGWYPYFWDAFVVEKSVRQLRNNVRCQWLKIMKGVWDRFRPESREFFHVWNAAINMLLCEFAGKVSSCELISIFV